MAFYQKTGHRQGESFLAAASTVITVGSVLDFDGNGQVIPATALSSHSVMVSGVAKKSTDGDYASATLMNGAMLSPAVEFECDTVAGTATAGMVGKSYDLTNSQTLNVAAQTLRVFTITKFVSATKVWGRFNSAYLFKGGAGSP